MARRSTFFISRNFPLLLPLAAGLLAATPAAGQTPGVQPPAVQPPGVQAPTREELERRGQRRPVPRSRLEVQGELERAPCALDRPDAANVRFTPTRVSFDNLRGVQAEALRAAYEPYIGKEQPITVVCEIRDRAATILRDAGYIASVEVPPQQIADGHVRFEVLMAKLVGVRVRGTGGRAERLIASYLQKLTRDEVFNRFNAERYLLLVNDLPGFVVRLSLRSAESARGEVIGEVTLLRTPVYADASVQNLGSEALGPWGVAFQGQVNDITGLGDKTTLTAYSTLEFEEQQTLQLAHDFLIGSEGLGFAAQITYAVAKPDLGDPTLNVESKTLFATLAADFPFVRSQTRNLRGTLGLDLVDQQVTFNGLDLSRDRLRVAFARLAGEWIAPFEGSEVYTMQEPRWRAAGSLELRQGLDIFGATQPCEGLFGCFAPGVVPPSRIDADPFATVLRGSVYGEYRPWRFFTVALGARLQHSDSSLLTFEEFSVGNYTVGRGYDPGIAIGDRGGGIQAEVRYGSVNRPNSRGIATEAFAFLDEAWTDNEPLAGAPAEEEQLTSFGLGLRMAIAETNRVELMVAAPLDRVAILDRRPEPRILLTFSTSLWPWRF
jgi:hemolysin activation/secretion protein